MHATRIIEKKRLGHKYPRWFPAARASQPSDGICLDFSMEAGYTRSMKWLRFVLAVGVVLWMSAAPAQASLWFMKLFSSATAGPTYHARRQSALPGQKVKMFRLHQANAEDLLQPLLNYLDGIHSAGSLVIDAKENSLIATDDPDTLNVLQALIGGMDRPYANANKMARRMLATQQMMKTIHALSLQVPGAARAAPGAAAGAAGAAAALPALARQTAPAPAGISGSDRAFSSSDEEFRLRVLEERPPLRAFEILGWMKDDQGTLVVLRNSGQRYIYRRGKLLVGSLNSTHYLKGIRGEIKGERLVLTDMDQGNFALSMAPRAEGDRNFR